MYSNQITFPTLALIALALLVNNGALFAAQSETPLAIKGYSPVSYFEHGRAEIGDSAYATIHNQRTYHFTSAEQLALFEGDPKRYAPKFPDHCPYNLALGRQAAIDPYNFRILDGHLLIFHRTEEMDGREAWETHGNDEELLERARSHYTLFRF